jgi:hypothetical protein
MPTECNPELFDFARVESRAVVAAFDGGRITSDAGALLLGATDRVVGLTRRLAACFTDARNPDLIEHDVDTLVTQRVVGIALGYEDLSDHDELRHDSVMAVLGRQTSSPPVGLRAVGWQVHAEPAGTQPPTTHALRPPCCRYGGDRDLVRRLVPGRAQESGRPDHARSRRHR